MTKRTRCPYCEDLVKKTYLRKHIDKCLREKLSENRNLSTYKFYNNYASTFSESSTQLLNNFISSTKDNQFTLINQPMNNVSSNEVINQYAPPYNHISEYLYNRPSLLFNNSISNAQTQTENEQRNYSDNEQSEHTNIGTNNHEYINDDQFSTYNNYDDDQSNINDQSSDEQPSKCNTVNDENHNEESIYQNVNFNNNKDKLIEISINTSKITFEQKMNIKIFPIQKKTYNVCKNGCEMLYNNDNNSYKCSHCSSKETKKHMQLSLPQQLGLCFATEKQRQSLYYRDNYSPREAVLPGPKKSKNLFSFLYTFVEELKVLSDKGMNVTVGGTTYHSKVFLFMADGDSPGAAELCGVSHSSSFGCRVCTQLMFTSAVRCHSYLSFVVIQTKVNTICHTTLLHSLILGYNLIKIKVIEKPLRIFSKYLRSQQFAGKGYEPLGIDKLPTAGSFIKKVKKKKDKILYI
ncbi:hypothetical protein BJ944DRAFT_275603 [Cunninghamella echinulata]|nr:hypothetical protein BJ944DRAFT_275603 [Cunninghamella echinulata]